MWAFVVPVVHGLLMGGRSKLHMCKLYGKLRSYLLWVVSLRLRQCGLCLFRERYARRTFARSKGDSNPAGCRGIMKGLFLAIILIAMVLGIGSFCVLLRQKNTSRGTYLRVVTDKTSYKVGDEVQIAITCVNDQNVGVTLSSLSYGIEVSNPQGVVFIMTTHQTSQGPVHMAPFSEQFVGNCTWNQKDMNGNQVSTATYTIRICLLDSTICGSTTINIS